MWAYAAALLPLAMAIAAIIALYASDLKRPKAALAFALLTTLLGLQGSCDQYSAQVDRRAACSAMEKELQQVTNELVGLMVTMTVAASDSWLPASQEELFSQRAAETFAVHLDLAAKAPVFPDQPWSAFIGSRAQTIRDQYERLLYAQAGSFDAELLSALEAVRGSMVLQAWPQLDFIRRVGKDAPAIRSLGDSWIPFITEDLKKLRTLDEILRARTGTGPYPPPAQARDRLNVGVSRYQSEQSGS